MIYEIVDKLATELGSALEFSDVIVGIVHPTKKNISGTEKTLPIYYKEVADTCETNYKKLIPDNTKKSIIYFELINSEPVATHNAKTDFEATVRLVCWTNYKRISPLLFDSSKLLVRIMDEIPEKIDNFDCAVGIRLDFGSFIKKEDLFGQYSYNEAERQFLTYPYDAFGIELNISFIVPKNCISAIVIEESC